MGFDMWIFQIEVSHATILILVPFYVKINFSLAPLRICS